MLIDKELIREAKRKLGDANFLYIMDFLGVEDYDEVRMKCRCPVHNEKTASFLYDRDQYRCHCFGCGASFDFIEAAMRGRNLSFLDAAHLLFDEAKMQVVFGEQGVRTKREYKYPHEEPINEKASVYAYMAKRGISQATVDYADVREDAQGNCVFNYYDTNDVLTNVKYRPSHKIDKSSGQPKMWYQKGADTTPLLFNINRVSTDSPLLITEGEMDALAAIEAGYLNAVSVPFGANNFTWIESNWEVLEQFESVIIASDNDGPGLKMQKECVSRLGSWRTKYVQVPEKIASAETGEMMPCKDLNEVLYYGGKDALLSLILNAKDSPVSSVRDLSDIEDIDLDKLDGVPFGIKAIDQELMRLFYGTLTIVSGLPGAGKTSFLYQLICNAVDTQIPCWIFSRELPSWMTKNWMLYILAGRRNLVQAFDRSGAEYYKVPPQVKQEISEHYRGLWYVYDDEQSNKLDDLLVSMTDVVRKYGVKLLLLDNLMTIDIGANENTELQKQTETINRLIQFTRKYNVAVVLVAHPRKMANTSDVGIQDIAGTSNIINLAHRALTLRRVSQAEKAGERNYNDTQWKVKPYPYDVRVTVLKDRLRGRAGFEHGMYYDKASRRFFSNPEEYDHQYGFDTHVYTEPLSYPVVPPADLAFGGGGEENV